MGPKTNLPCRRIPNNFCGYPPPRWLEHNSPLLKCGLYTVTSFQRVQCGNREKSNCILNKRMNTR